MQSKQSETRQSWTYQEDKLLLELIKLNGCASWNRIAIELQSKMKNPTKIRSPAACRERYQNILNPNLNKSIWTEEEEQKLFNLQQQFGNSWARIASQMTGRSDLLCKNYFYATLRKVLRRLSKAVGLDQSSDLLKQIKPSVLGVIYCNEDSLKSFNIDEEMKNDFKKMIKQYRHTEKSELRMLPEEEINHIKTMLNKLFAINNNYITQKGAITFNKNNKQDLISLETSKINLNQNCQSDSKMLSKIQTSTLKHDYQEEYDQQLNYQTQIFQEQQPIQNLDKQPYSNHYSYPQPLISMYTPTPVITFYIQPNFNIWPIQPAQLYSPPQCLQIPQTYTYIKYEQSQ
ncbi:unnamed protein product (macronuclear) [Paramecium tetraurelia]|uniref:Myb-like DNA-binding domain protein n=1 Tax=Paramecium tetraurelia TaxID=5888 RepID=A0DD99_PARTE|nr:uncharacterized protein GSPATT00015875001 [Paramecium tetraurelia]CAK81016.1 unnamed protein product [Paramecium tetraurelia]|eukprot:XP_001448413.1 hypothetical protein (macronuclear) [Paramecium tetraurelia strain d4-2]